MKTALPGLATLLIVSTVYSAVPAPVHPVMHGDNSFNVGGFALGFLLATYGVIIAYLIRDGRRRSRIKWAWIGFAAIAVLFMLLVVLPLL